MAMEGVYETTSMCPYTGQCESYRVIVNSERWMEKALSQLRRSGQDRLPQSEGGYSDHVLMSKLEQLKRVKDRCYSHNGRCLRFWQFERRSQEEDSVKVMIQRMRANLLDSVNEPQVPIVLNEGD